MLIYFKHSSLQSIILNLKHQHKVLLNGIFLTPVCFIHCTKQIFTAFHKTSHYKLLKLLLCAFMYIKHNIQLENV